MDSICQLRDISATCKLKMADIYAREKLQQLNSGLMGINCPESITIKVVVPYSIMGTLSTGLKWQFGMSWWYICAILQIK